MGDLYKVQYIFGPMTQGPLVHLQLVAHFAIIVLLFCQWIEHSMQIATNKNYFHIFANRITTLLYNKVSVHEGGPKVVNQNLFELIRL